MQVDQNYMEIQRKILASLEAELDIILKATKLDLFLTINNHGRKEYETRDYSLADRVEIEEYSTYGTDYYLIQFLHDLRTTRGDLEVYCRHKDWNKDDKRYAQVSSKELPYNTKRHDIQSLLDFYGQQGVKPGLIQILKGKIEAFYQQLTPEELDLDGLEEPKL